MDLAGPAQVFYEAAQLGRISLHVQYAAIQKQVETAQTLPLSPNLRLTELRLQKGDFCCIPGVDFAAFERGELDAHIRPLGSLLRQWREQGVLLGSICSGALVLAELGLLDGYASTTHWKCMDFMEQHYPKVRLKRDRLYCFDRDIYTSAGMTSGIDMSLALVERWAHPLLAAKVAQEMVINVRRPETQSQENTFLNFKNHFHPQVYQAQEILANDLRTEFTLEELSKKLHLSSRQLARLFKRYTGQTIHAYRSRLRMECGERLLLHSNQSIKEIALACGFAQSRQFIRLWKQEKGYTPREWRKQQLSVKPQSAELI